MSGLLRKRGLLGSLVIAALLLVLASAVSACGSSGDTSTLRHATASDVGGIQTDGKPAPAFSGVTLDKKTLSLDQFRGKPLLLVYMTGT